MLIQPIDIFVYAWLIVAVFSAAYVAWDQFHGNPEPAVMKWGFVLVTLYMGPIGLLLYVMADKEPTPGGHEEVHQAALETGRGLDGALRRGRRHRHHRGGRHGGADRSAHVVGPDHRIHRRFPVRPADLPGAVHAQDDGRHLRRKREAQLPARADFDELHDGRDGAGHGVPDDGPRHARDVARRAAVLDGDVARRHRRFRDRLSGQCLDGVARNETRADDRSGCVEETRRHGGHGPLEDANDEVIRHPSPRSKRADTATWGTCQVGRDTDDPGRNW